MNKHVNASKITAIGNSSGIILSKEVMAKLRVNRGDEVFLTETRDGFLISPYDAEFAAQMEVAEIVMREDRDVLKILAK